VEPSSERQKQTLQGGTTLNIKGGVGAGGTRLSIKGGGGVNQIEHQGVEGRGVSSRSMHHAYWLCQALQNEPIKQYDPSPLPAPFNSSWNFLCNG